MVCHLHPVRLSLSEDMLAACFNRPRTLVGVTAAIAAAAGRIVLVAVAGMVVAGMRCRYQRVIAGLSGKMAAYGWMRVI